MKIGILLTTFADRQKAELFCRSVITQKLAACAQMDEVSSLYIWNGQLQEDTEIRVTLKFPLEKEEQLVVFLEENHEYDIPERIILKGEASEPYGEWCIAACR